MITHPSGMQTNDYEVYRPNDVQLQSTAWRVRDHNYYRRSGYQPHPFVIRFSIFALTVGVIVTGYLVLKNFF